MEDRNQNLVGQTLGTCTLEKLIGQGGMGSVYLARQARPQRNVAVKVLLPNLSMDSEGNQDFLARFRREADVIARLEHVNIMPIYEYGEKDGLAYLVMPYLTGGSLREVLSKRGALPLETVATYIDQAAAALDYAHAHGVIHRDLKPANFLLHADGRLVLADFGIARIMDENSQGSTLTGVGTLLGTPEYMAPEMARGEQIDYRADIYELGIVLFQMLTGHVPFTGGTPYAVVYKHVQETIPLLRYSDPSIPSAVDTVIQKATAKSPEDRYVTVKDMAQDLRAALSGQQTLYAGRQNQSAVQPPIQIPVQPPLILPAVPPRYEDVRPAYNPANYNATGYNATGYNQRLEPPPPHLYGVQVPTPRRTPVWTIVIAVVFVLIILAGVLFAAARVNKGGVANNPAASPTTVAGSTPQPTTAPQPTPTVAPTTAPQPTGAAPTPVPAGGVPIGAQLYAAPAPATGCDNGGGQWSSYNGVQINCQANGAQIANTAQKDALQGAFLTKIPGRAYPMNYVVQVQIQPNQNSSGDFGIYVRNQPGNQLGAYTFLLRPDGHWSFNVYDNTTGAPSQLAQGSLNSGVQNGVQMAVAVKGSHLSFYVNGQSLGSVDNADYPSGTAGLAVGAGSSILASNFALYRIAS
ncbi:MAG: hypothetical protein NVS2B12_35380 [Ktedonobacteraceae bacterium]